jgi:hypothetical protein
MNDGEMAEIKTALKTLTKRMSDLELSVEELSEIIVESTRLEWELANRILKIEGDTCGGLT